MPPASNSLPVRRHRGFTLVELLTATAIMALIVSLVLTILTQVLNAWNRSSDNLTFSGQARQVFNILTQDLQGAIIRSDGAQWLSLTPADHPTGTSIPASSDTRLIFFTSTPLRQTKDGGAAGGAVGKSIPSDICAVEYRVTYADPFGTVSAAGGNTRTFTLHRVVLDPASTLLGVAGNPIMGLSDASGGFKSLKEAFDSAIDHANGNAIVNTTTEIAGGNTLEVPIYGAFNPDSTLLNNVASFNVYLYFNGQLSTSAPPLQVFPMGIMGKLPDYYYGGLINAKPAPSAGYFDGLNGSVSALPTFLSYAYADVSITIISDDGVVLLQQGNGALPANLTWPQFLQQYGKTYTQRIPFLSTPH